MCFSSYSPSFRIPDCKVESRFWSCLVEGSQTRATNNYIQVQAVIEHMPHAWVMGMGVHGFGGHPRSSALEQKFPRP